jgi:Tol biopolymer transport system component
VTRGIEVWSQPGWSSDGKRLVFSGKVGELDEIYVVNVDGSGLVKLTRGADGLR